MPNPVVHFEATAKDGDKLRDFYGKTFGWTFNVMQPMDYGVVDNGGAGANGGVGSGEEIGSPFYVAVPDPQASLDKAVSLGGAVTMPVMEIPDVVTLAMFTDPEGNAIGLVKDGGDPPPSTAPKAEYPVTWFEVVGKDGAKLRDFYSQLFGWQFNVPPDMDYGMVTHEGNGIDGGVGSSMGGEPHAIWYVETPDPQGLMDKITANGGKVAMPVTDGGMATFANFEDPAGNLVGIFKMNQ